MRVAPGAIVRLIILLPRCRPKAPVTRTYPAPRNLSSKMQIQPRHVTMWRSRLKKKTRRKRRRGSGTRGESILMSKPRPLESIPRPQRRRSRPDASTVMKKAIIQMSAPNLQKISVSLGNLRASD